MKYGNLQVGVPQSFKEDKKALDELLESGDITSEEYKNKVRSLDYRYLLFIAQTNNTSQFRTKQRRKTLGERRDDFLKYKSQEILDDMRSAPAHVVGEQEIDTTT